jgi:uncharacterized membrane protein YjdF
MINKYLLPLFIASGAILFLHLKGIDNEFYWLYWWYDIPMHLFGGVVITLIYAWLQRAYPVLPSLSWKSVLLVIIAVGFLWEVWELVIGDTSFTDNGYTADTIKDFFNDTVGACVTYLIIKKIS